ncbi:peptide chain release factor N(5)-glutamine methyltransferase [Emcibacter sp.]|uniref:peptide chain release factor N(5)-glutamine methyltransferase n=1 Tax=Emcibacter sp. TaxID=1979954 RepID=UPI003A8D2B4F
MTPDLSQAKGTVAFWLREVRNSLAACDIETAELDARVLLAHVLGCTPMNVYLQQDRELTESEVGFLEKLLARRRQREPLSHILGEKEFWSLSFKVTPDVLTPRPDSETLIQAALDKIRDRTAPLRILDLGTGSGCLLLSLLSELQNASGLGLDISEAALAVARENAERLGLSERAIFIKSDWTSALARKEKFDVILSNPPYIGLSEKESLPPEVREFEPERALYSGEEGLDDYRKLITRLPDFLAVDGFILFEIGAGQGASLKELLSNAGIREIEIIKDLAGRDRCVAWRP